MKKLIFALFFFIFTNVYSQNFFTVLRRPKIKPKTLPIQRHTIATYNNLDYASKAILTKASNIDISYIKDKIILQTEIQQPLVHPLSVSGGYNYLRIVSQQFREEPNWKYINRSSGYNGVHHIINKSVLKIIYTENTKELNELLFTDFVNNAPAIFHPLHNDTRFSYIFHDCDKQIALYEDCGIKCILTDFFDEINIINESLGLPIYDEETIQNTLIEARFWAETYGLVWKKTVLR